MAQAKHYKDAKVILNGVEFETDVFIDDSDIYLTANAEPVEWPGSIIGATIEIESDDPRAANKLAGLILLKDRMN